MNKRQATTVTAAGLVVLALGFLVTRQIWARWDLTSGRAYSISKASRELFKDIEDTVTITYYVSEKLEKIHPMPAEIKDLLREYAAYSRGKIRLVFQDPVKAGTVAAAEGLGVQPQQIQTVEKDQQSVATVYSGLVVDYLGRTETIPVAFSLDTLEYDLTTRIRAAVKQTVRSVGAMVAGADKTWANDYSYLAQALTAGGYQVKEVAPGTPIPDGLGALLVFGGAALDDAALYRLDAYIRSGGRVMFAVDGVDVNYRVDLAATPVAESRMLEMLAAYGVRVERQLALDKSCRQFPQPVRIGERSYILPYYQWVSLLARNAAKSHPVTARFAGLDLYWASPLTVAAPTGVSAQVLASSSPEAWKMTKNFVARPDLQAEMSAEQAATKGQIPLVVALTGAFPSFFAGQPLPASGGEALPAVPAQAAASRLLVVGDSEFASNLVEVTGSGQNLQFVVSSADWLSNDEDILAIRNRAARDTRLNKLSDPDERASAALASQIINVGLVPAGLAAFGLVRAVRRRRGFAAAKKESGHDLSA
jgi:gliding-associated putative ABC transporter substrate-binding component GldG